MDRKVALILVAAAVAAMVPLTAFTQVATTAPDSGATPAPAPGAPPASGLLSDPESSRLLAGSELGAYNESYLGLHSFWSDDIVSSFFKHAADHTLDQVRPLVVELCAKWRHRDPHLPVTGVISVPPGVELDLNRLCR